MKKNLLLGAVAALALFAAPRAFAEEAYVAAVKDYIDGNIKAWVNDPAIIDAIKAQNAKNAALAQGDVDALDQKWRGEVEAEAHPMIDGVLSNPTSAFLKAKQEESGGSLRHGCQGPECRPVRCHVRLLAG